jgi:hypothetical protein
MSVAQQERAVHEVADAGELVRGDDRRDAVLGRFMHRARQREDRFRWRGIIDEHDVVGTRRRVRYVRRAGRGEETRALAMLDRARVDATQPRETLQQRRRSGARRAEDGDALTFVHLEAGGAQHPDPRRASGDAGGVARPQGVGAKDEWHD